MESEIFRKQRKEIKETGFDGLVSLSPENTTYTDHRYRDSSELIQVS
jgi:hypothetical protein